LAGFAGCSGYLLVAAQVTLTMVLPARYGTRSEDRKRLDLLLPDAAKMAYNPDAGFAWHLTVLHYAPEARGFRSWSVGRNREKLGSSQRGYV
jgi:hypothetical protein